MLSTDHSTRLYAVGHDFLAPPFAEYFDVEIDLDDKLALLRTIRHIEGVEQVSLLFVPQCRPGITQNYLGFQACGHGLDWVFS